MMEPGGRSIVNVYVVLPPGPSSGGECGAPQRLHLSFNADPLAAGGGRESRGRSLWLTSGVAALVSLAVMVAVQAVTRGGPAGAAAHQVAAAVPPRAAAPSLAIGQAGSPASVAEALAHDLAQPPRVTPAPGAGTAGGPSAFGFNP
jgi:hypothetical protein